MSANLTFSGADVYEHFEDFNLKANATLPLPWVEKDVSSAGTPANDFTGNYPGEWQTTHAATNENEITGLFWNDAVSLDPTKGLVFEARVKLTAAGGVMASTERMVVGLASAHNDDLDAITNCVWFRVGDAADLAVKVESDDGTTNTDDQAGQKGNGSAVSVTSGSYHTYRIELDDLSRIKFVFDGELIGTTSASELSSGMQPYIMLEKDSGTDQHAMTVDYCHIKVDRD